MDQTHEDSAAGGDAVKLLSFWSSPYSMRAILALESKGVEYELIPQDLANKSELLLRSNPIHKKVPVLLHGAKVIPESLIIARYVDETWPGNESRPAFFPRDPYGRALTQFWSDFIDKKIMEVAFKTLSTSGEEKEAICKELYGNIVTLEGGFVQMEAIGKPLLEGGRNWLGFAGIALAPFVAWMPVFEETAGVRMPTAEEAPHFHKFCSAILEVGAAKVAFPEREKLLSFVAMMMKMYAAAAAAAAKSA